jgi:hypothetical protein
MAHSLELEREFHEALYATYRTIREEIPRYNPSQFHRMLGELGGLATARTLLRAQDVSPGFLRLYEHGRLDLALEAIVIQPKWRALFSQEELNVARERLRKYGYSFPTVQQQAISEVGTENGFPELKWVVAELNRRAASHRIGRLQAIRKELKPNSRSGGHVIFDVNAEWTEKGEYAYHYGGRHEFQFNVGFEVFDGQRIFRHGIAFSLERSQWVHDVVEVLLPKIKRFNEFLHHHPHRYSDLAMWYWRGGKRSPEFPPSQITPEIAQSETFIMLGRRTDSPPLDLDLILNDFDRLLPVYRFVESLGSEFPSLDNPITGLYFVPGHRPAKLTGEQTVQRRVLDMQFRHNDMQTKVYEHLVSEYGAGNVGTEQINGPGNRVDIVVRVPTGYWYYEIKTGSSARACIREAMGQVLEYSYWPSSREAERLFIVGESPPSEEELAYLRVLRERLGLPVDYRWLDHDSGELKEN